jgi:hypothetical protein
VGSIRAARRAPNAEHTAPGQACPARFVKRWTIHQAGPVTSRGPAATRP